MKAVGLLTQLFRRALGLYPAGYRAVYAEEREVVFRLAAEESASLGCAALLVFALRELAHLPGAALAEHLHCWRWGMLANLRQLIAEKPSGWGSAILAGLPHLLFALFYYGPGLLQHFFATPPNWTLAWHRLLTSFPLTRWMLYLSADASYWFPQRVFFQSVQWAFGLLVLGMIYAAWQIARRQGWPAWSPSWIGYGLLVVLTSLIELFPQDTGSLISILLWLGAASYIYIRQTANNPLRGLVTLLPFCPMFFWFVATDGIRGFYTDIAAYTGAALLVCLAVIAIVRTGSIKLAAVLLLALQLLVGGGYSYATLYHSNSPFPADPTVGKWIGSTLGGYLALVIFSLPVWGTLLWLALRRKRAMR